MWTLREVATTKRDKDLEKQVQISTRYYLQNGYMNHICELSETDPGIKKFLKIGEECSLTSYSNFARTGELKTFYDLANRDECENDFRKIVDHVEQNGELVNLSNFKTTKDLDTIKAKSKAAASKSKSVAAKSKTSTAKPKQEPASEVSPNEVPSGE